MLSGFCFVTVGMWRWCVKTTISHSWFLRVTCRLRGFFFAARRSCRAFYVIDPRRVTCLQGFRETVLSRMASRRRMWSRAKMAKKNWIERHVI